MENKKHKKPCKCEFEEDTTASYTQPEHDEEKCHCHKCEDENTKTCNCENDNDLAVEYLNMAKIIQADFENYRKRTAESLKTARQDGIISAVEIILPSIDVFKKAKEMIADKSSIKGIEMVEAEIQNSLKTLNVDKIEAINKEFDPKFHNAIAIVEDKAKPNNTVLEEYSAGYKMGDKIIRYSQVIVNKIKEEK